MPNMHKALDSIPSTAKEGKVHDMPTETCMTSVPVLVCVAFLTQLQSHDCLSSFAHADLDSASEKPAR